MSLIEQAAKRLEELRRAGAELTETQPDAKVAGSVPGVERAGAPQHSAAPVAPVRPTPVSKTTLATGVGTAHVQVDPGSPARDVQTKGEAQTVSVNLETVAASGIVTPNAPRTPVAD